MPVCLALVTDASGAVVGLRPDATVSNLSTCAYVAQTGLEYSQGWASLGNLTIEDAQVIAPYVGLVWAIAWGFRVIAKFLLSYPTSGLEP